MDQRLKWLKNEKQQEEKLFLGICYSTNSNNQILLIVYGYSHHNTKRKLFHRLGRSYILKAKISNGEYLKAKRKGYVILTTPSSIKTIFDVFLMLNLEQKLLNVGKIIKK